MPDRELPGEARGTRLERVAEPQGPLPLGDGGEVDEVDVADAVPLDVVGDLVGHVLGLAHHVAGGPHLRRRAERALVRAAAGRQHRHRATAVDARRSRRSGSTRRAGRGPTPGGGTSGSFGGDAGGETTVAGLAAVAEDHALDAVERDTVGDAVGQLDDRRLALAEHAGVDGVGLLEHPRPEGRGVLAAADDEHIGEPRPDRLGDLADVGPLVQEHVGDPDHLRVGVDAVDDLGDRQAAPTQPTDRAVDVDDAVDGLAGRVDHVDLVAGVAQHGGDVGQPDRRHGPIPREALRKNDGVRSHQGHSRGQSPHWSTERHARR